jgi:hypothetical protein
MATESAHHRRLICAKPVVPRRAIAKRRQGLSREALEQFLRQLAGWAGDDQVENIFVGMAKAMLAERPKTGEEALPGATQGQTYRSLTAAPPPWWDPFHPGHDSTGHPPPPPSLWREAG